MFPSVWPTDDVAILTKHFSLRIYENNVALKDFAFVQKALKGYIKSVNSDRLFTSKRSTCAPLLQHERIRVLFGIRGELNNVIKA